MDYLSGNSTGLLSSDKKRKFSLQDNIKDHFTFGDYYISTMNVMNSDEKMRLREKFLTPEVVEVLEDDELVECINAFFENNLNISETSRNAFMHRNTLLYRIDKIYKLTGLNIRNFEDAMSFRVLTFLMQDAEKESKKWKNLSKWI